MIIVLLTLIGLCVGSFINVVIDRIPNNKSILIGRSVCDFCGKKLSALDLIPVFSYIFLQGKCRYCHKKLSLQYPLIEIICAFLFLLIYFLEMPVGTMNITFFLLDISMAALGLALAVMDIKYRILSDKLLIALFLLAGFRISVGNVSLLFPHVGIGLLSAFPLLLIFILSKGRAMGFGDVKLISILGFLLGFPYIIVAYYIAFLTGAVSGVILILRGKRGVKGATIAFGPFLLLAAFITNFWGDILWNCAKVFMGF